jgi:hypothetical protein
MIKLHKGKPITSCMDCDKMHYFRSASSVTEQAICVTKQTFFNVDDRYEVPDDCPLKDYQLNMEEGLIDIAKGIIQKRAVSALDIKLMEELVKTTKKVKGKR